MNKKLFTYALSIIAILSMVFGVAAAPGPDTNFPKPPKPPKPEYTLSVCYVLSGDSVTAAKFGYQAENMPGKVWVSQDINHPYLLPFGKPGLVGQNTVQVWSSVYPLKKITWSVNILFVGNKHVSIDKNIKAKEVLHRKMECPTKPAPFEGYSIPFLILYKATELTNGYGVLVSTEPFASIQEEMAAFGLTAIPTDFVEACVGPVGQRNVDDMQGYWTCDGMLKGILANGHDGGRLPLLNGKNPSLQNIYEQLLAWLK